MSNRLTVLAGPKALEKIRAEGLRPEMITVLAGAAGGPKWLVLNRIDRALFQTWFKGRTQPLFCLGSSIGAWRFTAAAQEDPLAAVERFEHAYIHQTYTEKPTRDEIAGETERILDSLLGQNGAREILNHPFLRVNMLSVRCLGPTASENKLVLGLGFLCAYVLNSLGRVNLKYLFERTLFHDPREKPPFFDMTEFPIQRVPLTADNYRQALLATSAIPLVMAGAPGVDGARPGMYRDGGVIDYHLDVPFQDGDGLTLFPHFSGRVIPGWLDKNIKSRQPSVRNMDSVVLVAPSRAFIADLPSGKVPDREDFTRFKGLDNQRISTWKTVVEKCEPLGEDFLELCAGGKIKELVRPLFPKK
ncbi:MAG: patatin-like phospholipase family protein [Pseudomonadota bacterium]